MSAQVPGSRVHIHDPLVEGPLPPGFPVEGREGKVRNVYMAPRIGMICLIASDRVSAFDQVSPTPIPGKGKILNDIATRELKAAEEDGIQVWLQEVPEDNPRAAVGYLGKVLPIEFIFRNYMTGSMWREYEKTGDFAGFGLPPGMREWHDFTAEPLFTPSTKSDIKDVSFNPANSDVEILTGVSAPRMDEAEAICRRLFALGTRRALDRGLILVDTKYEVGIWKDGSLMIIDEVHTPDSSRFVIADGFKEAVARGERPESLSKEFLRLVMLDRAGGDVDAAKRMMAQPLPSDVVKETLNRYQQLHALFAA